MIPSGQESVFRGFCLLPLLEAEETLRFPWHPLSRVLREHKGSREAKLLFAVLRSLPTRLLGSSTGHGGGKRKKGRREKVEMGRQVWRGGDRGRTRVEC